MLGIVATVKAGAAAVALGISSALTPAASLPAVLAPMVVASGASSGFDLSDLLSSGTSVISWLISAMTSFLGFMTSNTALLVWFFASLALLGLKIIRGFF